MRKSDLKKVLKPIIKECLKELLLEEKGVLSHLIAEVANGLSGKNTESTPIELTLEEKTTQEASISFDRKKLLREQREKLMHAIGSDAYSGVDIFEGTKPIKAGGVPGGDAASLAAVSSPLGHVDPEDSGVDLSNFMTEGVKMFWKQNK